MVSQRLLAAALDRLQLLVAQLAEDTRLTSSVLGPSPMSEPAARMHQRQHAAVGNYGEGRASRVFKFGANAEVLNYLDLDPQEVLGLEAAGIHYALAIAEAALVAGPDATRGDLLRHILGRPGEKDWRRSGAWVRFEAARDAYEDEVAAFLTWDAKRPAERRRWRTRSTTLRQQWLIQLIADANSLPPPTFARRGDAFDWIFARGGHPRFAGGETEFAGDTSDDA